MPNNYFKFKQFTIWQDKCAMKVGTDGVLLGAWTDCSKASKILDIGTGTGLIALMLAQRTAGINTYIDAIEIEENASKQAQSNITKSKWNNRINVYNKALQNFTPTKKYDLIVTNPPYFINSLAAQSEERTVARHTAVLHYETILDFIQLHLEQNGKFSIIYPAESFNKLKDYALNKGLFLVRQTDIHPTPISEIKRILAEFKIEEKELTHNSLIIEENGRHQYSEGYISLTKDFYLKF